MGAIEKKLKESGIELPRAVGEQTMLLRKRWDR